MQILKHINSLNLSDEQKEQIAKRLGFIVEKGNVVEKNQ